MYIDEHSGKNGILEQRTIEDHWPGDGKPFKNWIDRERRFRRAPDADAWLEITKAEMRREFDDCIEI